jgi:hypothetical protein
VRFRWVTVALVVTESTPRVAVTPVACITTESTSRNSKRVFCLTLCSHPGYFGKKGQRHFHYQKNQYYKPTINLDKIWNLVPEDARKASTKDKAVVIDVVKSVSASLFNNNLAGLLQGSRSRRPPQDPLRRESPRVLQDCRAQNQGGWRCLPTRVNQSSPPGLSVETLRADVKVCL